MGKGGLANEKFQAQNTLYVDGTYGSDVDPIIGSRNNYLLPYQTIQAAIDASVSGDLIIVHRGLYAEHLLVNGGKQITINFRGSLIQIGDNSTSVLEVTDSGTILNVLGYPTILQDFSSSSAKAIDVTNGATLLGKFIILKLIRF